MDQDTLNSEGLAEPETAEESETSTDEATKKAEEYAQNQKIRAEKAERENKELKAKLSQKETPKEVALKNEMSLKDIRALADVHDDDVDSVVDWAKFKEISIAEAKKSSEIQALLRTRTEERQTAQAANVGSAKRGSSKISDESLLEKLEKNELSEEDIEKAVKARMEKRRA